MKNYIIDAELVAKIFSVVDRGLVKGLGRALPGQMCVEAAVCFAMGLPHSDKPVCVGDAVRSYKIRLNDSNWSSIEARAKGMRRVAVAQLGSDQIDQFAFSKEVTLQVTRQILPIALRAAAKLSPSHAEMLETNAIECEALIDFSQVDAAAYAAKAAAYGADAVADYDIKAATDAAKAAADAAADAAYAANDAAAYAADADAAAYAAAVADYASSAVVSKDDILTLAAEIGVQALIKLGSEGCKYIDI